MRTVKFQICCALLIAGCWFLASSRQSEAVIGPELIQCADSGRVGADSAGCTSAQGCNLEGVTSSFSCTREGDSGGEFWACRDTTGSFKEMGFPCWNDVSKVYSALRDAIVFESTFTWDEDLDFLVISATNAIDSNPGGRYRPLAVPCTLGIGLGNRCDDSTPPPTTCGIPEGQDSPFWDGTPSSDARGMIYMGPFKQYFTGDALEHIRVAKIFGQELAHSWLTHPFVSIRPSTVSIFDRSTGTDLDEDILLGSECSHWSFYYDSENSPMLGMDWMPGMDIGGSPTGDYYADYKPGVFSTDADSNGYIFQFNALERYLMGFVDETVTYTSNYLETAGGNTCTVNPANKDDCSNATNQCPDADANSAHLNRDSLCIEGPTEHTFSLSDVIAAEGPRLSDPRYQDERDPYQVVFILIYEGELPGLGDLGKFGELSENAILTWEELNGTSCSASPLGGCLERVY